MVVVLCHGTFDGLHVGHVAYLEAARALGDYLVVSVTADRWVKKGEGRPLFHEEERLRMIRSLRCVQQVFLACEPGPEGALRLVKPDIYCKGIEYKDRLPEANLCRELGIKVRFIDSQPIYSSTRLLTGLELAERIEAARSRSA